MKKNINEFLNCLEVLRYLQDHKNDTEKERRVYIEDKKGNYKAHYLEYDTNSDYIKEVKEYTDAQALDYIYKILK